MSLSQNFEQPTNLWQVQYERTLSTDFITKHNTFVAQGAESITPDKPQGFRQKPISSEDYYSRIAGYAINHALVTSSITYVPAAMISHNKFKKYELGTSGYGYPPLVYTDAAQYIDFDNRKDLTGSQKDLISAHETYHSIVDASTPFGRTLFKGVLNQGVLSEKERTNPHSWLTSPDEIMAQMAEMKNYFNMTSDEAFTEAHLEYIHMHYRKDTGLEKRLKVLLQTVYAGDKAAFISLMNHLPV